MLVKGIKMEINKIISVVLSIILLNLFLFGQWVHAKNQQEQDHSLDAHVHGLSEITLVFEAGILDIQLISPSVNLINFEHKPSNKKEVAMIHSAKALLSNAVLLFSFTGGGCAPINTVVDVSSLLKKDEDGHEHLQKNHQKTDDEHGEHASDENHTQVVANYRYRCEETLSTITVRAFEQFSGIDKIRAMWITDTKQGVVMLSAKDKVIRL